MTDIFDLVQERTALSARIHVLVVTVNSGPGNWTIERMGELHVLQDEYAALSKLIEAHPDYEKHFTRGESRAVGARKR